MALHFLYYNIVRGHQTPKMTRAMAPMCLSGLGKMVMLLLEVWERRNKPVSFDGLGHVPACEQTVHCLILTDELRHNKPARIQRPRL
jgi:hypothetical protein